MRPDPRPPAGRPWRYLLTGAPCDDASYRAREHHEIGPSPRARLAISVLVRAVASTLRARFDFSLSGELPASGCVLVSHHDSYWDGVVVAALDPRVVPVTSGRWRSTPAVGWVLDSYGVLWTSEQTVARATGLVRRGAACWVAPRAFDRGASDTPAHHGAAGICVDARAPLVPMTLGGLGRTVRRRRPRSAVEITIWPPIWPSLSESAEAFSSRLESSLPPTVY